MISLLKRRQREGLAYLYDHYSAALFGVVSRIVVNKDQAEEVLQDVFMKIWDRIDQYDDSRGKLFTWMLNIARNQAIDKTRSGEINKGRKTDPLEKVVSGIDKRDANELYVEAIGLKEVLTRLPEEQQFVVNYLYFKGYTQSELAEEFGIPLGTVKTRLRMAMIELRSILKVS